MQDKLEKSYIHKLRDLKYWLDMAKNPHTTTRREDLFYAALAAGQANMIALILDRDFSSSDGRIAEVFQYGKEILTLWEGAE